MVVTSPLRGLLTKALERSCALFLLLILAVTGVAQTNVSVVQVGTIEMAAQITESSGLARSPQYPDVFWTHNDNENPTFLYAMTRTGARVGAFEVQDMNLIDWEAIAADAAGNLYFADTGTNGMARSHSAVYRVREPNPYNRWGPVTPEQRWLIRFPVGRPDCEGMFIWNGFVYLVTKYPVAGVVDLFRFPLTAGGDSTLVQYVASVPVPGPISEAALSADGVRLALLGEGGVHMIFINGDPSRAGSADRQFLRYSNEAIEGGTFVEEGVLATGEGSPAVLLFSSPFFSGAPVFTSQLENQFAFVGDRVIFETSFRGVSDATLAWYFNGVKLPVRSSIRLVLNDVALEDSGLYQLVVSNAFGIATNSATLTVTERTNLVRITEVMSSESPGSSPTADWWELTNFDALPVDISGWRFNDSDGGLADGFAIPNGVIVAPGESVVFVEELSAQQFRTWWGESNVGTNVQVVTYSGTTLSFSSFGDTLRLWDDEATDDNDLVERVTFGQAEQGVSFGFDPDTSEFGVKSQIGVHGAFVAASGNDIGSPGRIAGGAAPAITTELSDRVAAEGSSVIFRITAVGNPAPAFEWRFNGVVIAGATNAELVLDNVTAAASGQYEVIVANEFGSDSSRAQLTVLADIIDLRITEVMSSEAVGGVAVADWWELTSFDNETIDISGWRFNDGTGDLNDAFRIPNGVVIAPNESIIFVENLTPEEFRTWWGSQNLPGTLRIITYAGTELSFAAAGDSVRVWDADAASVTDLFTSEIFGQADVGVSFTYDPTTQEFGIKSQAGVNGAFRAAASTDVGSPGRVAGGEPRFLNLLRDQVVEVGGAITLSAPAVGTPAPTYQWRLNGVDIPAATTSSLTINNLSMADTGFYELAASNELGTSVTRARVRVVANIPLVRVTEVMPSAADGAGTTADWWELTSYDNETLSLGGWRFNDATGDLTDAFVIPTGVTIAPGESIIFVEDISAGEFRGWWGPANLPPALQIITYSGAELSFSALGDSIRVWDAEASITNDVTARVDFGAADQGITFVFDAATGTFGKQSQNGVDGAFIAETGPDIGSPGRAPATAPTVQLTARAAGSQVIISFRAEAGRRYILEAADGLHQPWQPTGDALTPAISGLAEFRRTDSRQARFYRIQMQ